MITIGQARVETEVACQADQKINVKIGHAMVCNIEILNMIT